MRNPGSQVLGLEEGGADAAPLAELAGADHMAVIDPASPAWAEATRRLREPP